jgi:outer membrane murein-binding lipoprotein Lpp
MNLTTKTITAAIVMATATLAACGPSKVEEDTAAMRQIMEKQQKEQADDMKKQRESAEAAQRVMKAERESLGK